MRKISQLQYEVIFLYSKGLTFKEIDKALATASRGVYSQVLEKVHTPEQFGQPADLHPDTLPELIRTASRFIFGQF